jgi:hypothetical protein
MSTWRKKAIECAPELKKDFEEADLTPYTVFMELLPILRQAHVDRDYKKTKKIYEYADWCSKQKDKNLWNAAGVSFYEHLADTNETFEAFTQWINKDKYLEIRGLLVRMVEEEKIKILDQFYKYRG